MFDHTLANLLPTAAEKGFSFADPYVIGLFAIGVAVLVAMAALAHEEGRAFSSSMVYLVLGLGAAGVFELLDYDLLDPIDDARFLEKLTELAVITALFATGLQIGRPIGRRWLGVVRLLAIAMPLTIAAVTLLGTEMLGLSFGAALMLAAILAPTDPVLAGDIGIGSPEDEENSREPNFDLTGEAGLNDGLAYPFIFAAAFILATDGNGWVGEWLLADVLYALGVGTLIGAALGYGFGAFSALMRERRLLSGAVDDFLAVPVVLMVYGATETVGAYGFIAAFVAGLAFRRYERSHEQNQEIHDGAKLIEKVGELIVVLLIGAMVTLDGLGAPGVEGWALAVLLLLVIRPLAGLAAFAFSAVPWRERAFVAWFGVRGIGSVYYLAAALGTMQLSAPDSRLISWTVIAVILLSIPLHGFTAKPLSDRLLPPLEDAPDPEQATGSEEAGS